MLDYAARTHYAGFRATQIPFAITFGLWVICIGLLRFAPSFITESAGLQSLFVVLYIVLFPPGILVFFWIDGAQKPER